MYILSSLIGSFFGLLIAYGVITLFKRSYKRSKGNDKDGKIN